MLQNFEVKIIRFKNGEDIIAFVHEDNDSICIKCAKTFYFNIDTDTNTEELVIVDWMNNQAFSTQEVTIDRSNILFSQYPNIKFGYEYLYIIQEEIDPETQVYKQIKQSLELLDEQQEQILH